MGLGPVFSIQGGEQPSCIYNCYIFIHLYLQRAGHRTSFFYPVVDTHFIKDTHYPILRQLFQKCFMRNKAPLAQSQATFASDLKD